MAASSSRPPPQELQRLRRYNDHLKHTLELKVRDYAKLRAKVRPLAAKMSAAVAATTQAKAKYAKAKAALAKSKASSLSSSRTLLGLLKSARSQIHTKILVDAPPGFGTALAGLAPLPASLKAGAVLPLLRHLLSALLADLRDAKSEAATTAQLQAQVAAFRKDATDKVHAALAALRRRENEILAEAAMEREELEFQLQEARKAHQGRDSGEENVWSGLAAQEAAFEAMLLGVETGSAAKIAEALAKMPQPPELTRKDEEMEFESSETRASWSVQAWDSALHVERARRSALQFKYEHVLGLLHGFASSSSSSSDPTPPTPPNPLPPRQDRVVERLQFELEEARAQVAALKEQLHAQQQVHAQHARSPPPSALGNESLEVSAIYSTDHLALEALEKEHAEVKLRLQQTEEERAERDMRIRTLEADLAFYVSHFDVTSGKPVDASRLELLAKRVELLQHELAVARSRSPNALSKEYQKVVREKRELEAKVRDLWAQNTRLNASALPPSPPRGSSTSPSSSRLATREAELDRARLENELRVLKERFSIRVAADEYELQRVKAQLAASRHHSRRAQTREPQTPTPRAASSVADASVLSEVEVSRLESQLNSVRKQRSQVDQERRRLEHQLRQAPRVS